MKRGERKGVSAIVATLIIILLVVASVAIIWVVVKNLIEEGAEEISLGKFTIDMTIRNVEVTSDEVKVQVRREVGKGDLSGVLFLISDGENTKTVKKIEQLNELETRTFTISSSEIEGIGLVRTIEIAPIITSESGKESFGQISDKEISTMPISCKEISARENGIYNIDPDGLGSKSELAVYCDMTVDGGGWMLVGRSHPTNCPGGFGWMYSQGDVNNNYQCYSMNVEENGIEFTEVFFAEYTTGKTLGSYGYKRTVPEDLIESYQTSSYRSDRESENLLSGTDCMSGAGMLNYWGYTNRNDGFWARDGSSYAGYGLRKNSINTNYPDSNPNGCSLGGYMHGDQGMLFVR